MLADHYNSYDESTEWVIRRFICSYTQLFAYFLVNQDARIHEDFLTQNLGFAGWIQMGTWKSGGLTATSKNAKALHTKGGT